MYLNGNHWDAGFPEVIYKRGLHVPHSYTRQSFGSGHWFSVIHRQQFTVAECSSSDSVSTHARMCCTAQNTIYLPSNTGSQPGQHFFYFFIFFVYKILKSWTGRNNPCSILLFIFGSLQASGVLNRFSDSVVTCVSACVCVCACPYGPIYSLYFLILSRGLHNLQLRLLFSLSAAR